MTKVTRFNIAKPRTYNDKSGKEVTRWDQVGTLTQFTKDDGSVSRIIEIPAISLKASVFPFRAKEDMPQQEQSYDGTVQSDGTGAPNVTEEVRVEDIPF